MVLLHGNTVLSRVACTDSILYFSNQFHKIYKSLMEFELNFELAEVTAILI